ncbi:hypothetical protein AB0M43_08265 [Longispora sp. NPDC051575]|uniref:hypothetical protein n=1 Tax=Longispora sp. NPDC051575 TaxID=3154943 RepID=UPI003440DB55
MGIDELAGAALLAVLSDPDGRGRSWPAVVVRTRLTAGATGRGALSALVADPDNAAIRALARTTIEAELAADPGFATDVRRALGLPVDGVRVGMPRVTPGAVATMACAVLAVAAMALGAIVYGTTAKSAALRPLEGTWAADGGAAATEAHPVRLTVDPDHRFRYRAAVGSAGQGGAGVSSGATVECSGEVDTEGNGFVFRSTSAACPTFTGRLGPDRRRLDVAGKTLTRQP